MFASRLPGGGGDAPDSMFWKLLKLIYYFAHNNYDAQRDEQDAEYTSEAGCGPGKYLLAQQNTYLNFLTAFLVARPQCPAPLRVLFPQNDLRTDGNRGLLDFQLRNSHHAFINGTLLLTSISPNPGSNSTAMIPPMPTPPALSATPRL